MLDNKLFWDDKNKRIILTISENDWEIINDEKVIIDYNCLVFHSYMPCCGMKEVVPTYKFKHLTIENIIKYLDILYNSLKTENNSIGQGKWYYDYVDSRIVKILEPFGLIYEYDTLTPPYSTNIKVDNLKELTMDEVENYFDELHERISDLEWQVSEKKEECKSLHEELSKYRNHFGYIE